MKILVLGSEGFIGKHLVSYYLKKGLSVVGADILQTSTLAYKYFKISRLSPEFEELLQSELFDVCINAAGNGNVSYSMQHPVADFEANSLDVIKFLDGIRRYLPNCKYLHISSAAVYGNPNNIPISEDSNLLPLSPYGWHKWISELICKEYNSVYGIDIAIIRPFSVYGPGLQKQLLWDTYNKILLNSETIEMWGTGNETRDFIYIDDLICGIDLIITRGEMNGNVYNFGSGEEISIKLVTELLVSNLSPSTKIIFNNKIRVGDPRNWKADIDAIKKLGYSPSTSIEEGIKQVAKWLKNLN